MEINYSELEIAVQNMLDNENKRVEIANNWLNQLQATLLPVSADLWGNYNFIDCNSNTVRVSTMCGDTEIYADYYFRYGAYEDEQIGFYVCDSMAGYKYKGVNVLELKGSDYWLAIKFIFDWLDLLKIDIKNKNETRNESVEFLIKK